MIWNGIHDSRAIYGTIVAEVTRNVAVSVDSFRVVFIRS